MANAAFRDNVVIITGASSGLGAEMAVQLAGQGAKLVLAARSAENLERTAERCRAAGAEVLAVPTDIAQKAQCEALVDRAVEAFGRLDTLVNNAGISMWSRLDELQDLAIIENILQVNVMGAVYCTYYALPHLKASRGRIVAISSLAGRAGVPTRTGYSASKHALDGFFDSLRIELHGTGVSVTSIYPGFVSTGLHERIAGPDGKPLGTGHPVNYDSAMPTEKCAELAIRTMARRKRSEVMTLRGKLGQWIKLIAPGLVDRIAMKAIATGK